MDIALITGSCGLIGSEASHFFAEKGFCIAGIDNDMRQYFFGREASTAWNRDHLEDSLPEYHHHGGDIRDEKMMDAVFSGYGKDIKIIIHAAAQPSHDWAAREPFTDFSINATGTLVLLEMFRKYCPEAVFVFTSTNKVYGDTPNSLPIVELETRWELDEAHPYALKGIDETMTIDRSRHSLFGCSKVAADVMVQEYGKYFGLKTVCFRGGCLTGPNHSGAMLHGFLAYLMKCALTGEHYTIYGYKGKQVRDNIHSYDFVNMFWHFYNNPRCGEVYNAGGGRHANCSVLEAAAACETITGNKMNRSYEEVNRIGDHLWWLSDVSKFKQDYPEWDYTYDLTGILEEIYMGLRSRI